MRRAEYLVLAEAVLETAEHLEQSEWGDVEDWRRAWRSGLPQRLHRAVGIAKRALIPPVRVAAVRRPRPAVAHVYGAPSGGAYVSQPYPGPWLSDEVFARAPQRDDASGPGGRCPDDFDPGSWYDFDTAPAARKGYT